MNIIIHFTTSTRRLLDQRWHTALKQNHTQLVIPITALQGRSDKFKAETHCQFLSQVLEQTRPDQKVILIQDEARYHTGRSQRSSWRPTPVVWECTNCRPTYRIKIQSNICGAGSNDRLPITATSPLLKL